MSIFSKKEEPEDIFDEKFPAKYMNNLLRDQIKDRRWRSLTGMIRAVTILVMAVIGFILANRPLPWDDKTINVAHTAIISIDGVIASNNLASADKVNPVLRDAFKNENSKGVIVKINSPGGSAVQAGRIYDEIRQLKEQYNKPVYAVIDDIGASGGYYVAIAADKVFANRASLVGSIGVISSSFGFTELLEKLGIERRVITSGENKDFMDPFLPLTEDKVDFWKKVLETTHQQFTSRVMESRLGKIDANNKALFSGLIWNGEQAKELGLIDELSTPERIARDDVGEANLIEYKINTDVFTRLSSRSSLNTESVIDSVINYLSSKFNF